MASLRAGAALGGLMDTDIHSLAIRAHQITAWPTLWTSLLGIAVATIWNYQLNLGLTWGLWRRPE